MDSEAEMSANLETEQIGWKDLPNELLFRITVFLDVKEFLDFMLIEKRCRECSQSAAVQYRFMLQRYGKVDNAYSTMPLQAKMIELREREKNWLSLTPRREMQFDLVGQTSIYELQESLFLFCERPFLNVNPFQVGAQPTKLQLIALPNGNRNFDKTRFLPRLSDTTGNADTPGVAEEDNIRGKAVGLRETGLRIGDLTLDPTQDLLVISHVLDPDDPEESAHVPSFESPAPDTHPQRISPLHQYHFLTLSTFEPHPLAQRKTIWGPALFQESMVSQLLQVFGDVIAILSIPFDPRHGGRLVYQQQVNVWNWKTGQELCHFRIPESQTQASLALLSRTEFLVTLHRPDHNPSLEIYSFENPDTFFGEPLHRDELGHDPIDHPILLATLYLPEMLPDVQIDFDVRPDPPFPPSSSPAGNPLGGTLKPFTDNPERGVLVFNFTGINEREHERLLAAGEMGAGTVATLSFFVKKETVLAIAREKSRARLEQLHHRWLDEMLDIDYDTDREKLSLPWESWGIQGARIIRTSFARVNWVTFVHGYRYATLQRDQSMLIPRPRLGPHKVQVLDFSPEAVYAVSHQPLNTRASDDNTTADTALVTETSHLEMPLIFRREVTSSLPYVRTTTASSYETDGVMLDEGRLMITKAEAVGDGDIRQSIRVLAM